MNIMTDVGAPAVALKSLHRALVEFFPDGMSDAARKERVGFLWDVLKDAGVSLVKPFMQQPSAFVKALREEQPELEIPGEVDMLLRRAPPMAEMFLHMARMIEKETGAGNVWIALLASSLPDMPEPMRDKSAALRESLVGVVQPEKAARSRAAAQVAAEQAPSSWRRPSARATPRASRKPVSLPVVATEDERPADVTPTVVPPPVEVMEPEPVVPPLPEAVPEEPVPKPVPVVRALRGTVAAVLAEHSVWGPAVARVGLDPAVGAWMATFLTEMRERIRRENPPPPRLEDWYLLGPAHAAPLAWMPCWPTAPAVVLELAVSANAWVRDFLAEMRERIRRETLAEMALPAVQMVGPDRLLDLRKQLNRWKPDTARLLQGVRVAGMGEALVRDREHLNRMFYGLEPMPEAVFELVFRLSQGAKPRPTSKRR